MAEFIVLDPTEVATGRTQLDITPWVSVQGIDWGDGEIQAYMADLDVGATPVDYRIPNRTITVSLVLKAMGGTAFATARSTIQAKVGLFQRQGGWIKRITSSGGTVYADVVNATIKLPGSWSQAHKNYDVEASLTLEVLPDFYEAEVTLTDHPETTQAEVVFTETTIRGDYPARVRFVVDEDQGQAQLGLMWGVRTTNYSAASTARLAYEAEALQPLDLATKAALTGASGGTVVTHATLSTSWTPVLNLNLGGTAYLTHTGTYRLFCRYRTTAGTAVALRSVYDVGDLVLPEENDPWYHPIAGAAGTSLFIADLGELRLQQGPVGTHRWAGQIQGKGQAGTEDLSLDRVWFQPVDDGAGLLRAPVNGDPGLVAYTDRDEFATAVTGNLSTRTAPVGGVWIEAGAAGNMTLTPGSTRRTTAPGAAHFGVPTVAGFAAQVVQVDIKSSILSSGYTSVFISGVARYTDTSNYVTFGQVAQTLAVQKTVAGVTTDLASYLGTGGIRLNLLQADTWYRLRFAADTAGRWWFWYGTPTGGLTLEATGVDSALATGGALASGKPGIHDVAQEASTRSWTNFAAWPLTLDAVLNPSQSAELRTDGMFREDTSGSAYGPVSWVEGDLPRLPPGGTAEVLIKASRGDFSMLPDTGIDDLSARGFYNPCWVFVPS